MANGLYYGINQGALLRKIFPKQLNTQVLIIVWTIVFILNMVAAFCVHCFVMYPISDFSKESLQEHKYFKESTILSIEELRDCYITYENADGEKRVAHLEMFPGKVFERARIDKGYDRVANSDGSIDYADDTMSEIFWTGNVLKKLAGIYVGIGVALLLLEFFLFSIFHRLFRE